MVGVGTADAPAVVREGPEGRVQATGLRADEDGRDGAELLAGDEGVVPLVVGVVRSEQCDVGRTFAFAGLESPPRAGLDLPEPGAAVPVGEGGDREVPAGGPTPCEERSKQPRPS